MKKLMIALALLSMATAAGANTFAADGTVFEPTHGYTFNTDRYLVNDGSFEGGSCVNTPIWLCTTDNGCDWITDLVPLGLWNYDGIHVAWLGGFCGGLATCFTNICQDIVIDGCTMSVYWMAYVNDAVNYHYFTIDGNIVFEYTALLSDHLLDYQLWSWDTSLYADGNVHTFCLNVDAPGCMNNEGDNLFLDWVDMGEETATANTNLSTVKALY